MMQQMMQKMMGGGGGELNPAAMCQAMMSSVGKSAEMAAYATPEVRTLFEEWARSVEEEVLTVLKNKGPIDLAALAAALKISPESTLHFLAKLVKDGKASRPHSDGRRLTIEEALQVGRAFFADRALRGRA